MTDTARLSATRTERVRIDDATELAIDHAYGAAVGAAQPAAARMHSTTSVRVVGPAGTTELQTRTLTTSAETELEVDIRVNGQPFWHRHWNVQQRQMP